MKKRILSVVLAALMCFTVPAFTFELPEDSIVTPISSFASQNRPSDSGLISGTSGSAITGDMELIADFDFAAANIFSGSFTGAGAKAAIMGTSAFTYGTIPESFTHAAGSSYAVFNTNRWLEVTKLDGSPLLAGLNEFTVSYDVNSSVSTGNNRWVFFAQRTKRAPKTLFEHYIGALERPAETLIQRFNDSGFRRDFELIAYPSSGWRHIDITFTANRTALYINGNLVNWSASSSSPIEILSETGGYFYIGRSQWGSEFFTGQIANFKIYKPKDPGISQQAAAAKAALVLPYGVTENEVYGNITLPKTGLYNSVITWATDRPDIVDVKEYPIADYDPRPAGTVTRPAGGDTVVTMTATITLFGITETKTFEFTVKKAPEPVTTEAYLFTHFIGRDGRLTDEQVYFAVSEDAKTWTETRFEDNPVLMNRKGDMGARDPFMIRSPEGDKFYLIATDLSIFRRGGWGSSVWQNSSTNLVVWESTDLVNWSEERLVNVAGGLMDAGNAWAPEIVYDHATGDYFVFFAAWTTEGTPGRSPTGASNMYYVRTRDFYTFTTPKLWIVDNKGYGNNTGGWPGTGNAWDVIDTTAIFADDGNWYRVSKFGGNNPANNVLERAADTVIGPDGKIMPSLTGGWELINRVNGNLITPWNLGSIEGPQLFRMNRKDWKSVPGGGPVVTYGLYVDRFSAGVGYHALATTSLSDKANNSPHWSHDNVNMGRMRKSHGGIMTITKEEHDRILKYIGKAETKEPPAPEYPATFVPSLIEGMELIADFDFNNLVPGQAATVFTDNTGKARARSFDGSNNPATISISSTQRPPGETTGYSWEFTGNTTANNNSNRRWLDIQKADGAPIMLDGKGDIYGEIVVSFDVRRTGGLWAFYLDRNTTANSGGGGENYIGTLWGSNTSLTIERFRGGRPGAAYYASGTVPTSNNWYRVNIVVRPNSTALYVNGNLAGSASTANDTYSLESILTNPSNANQKGGVMHLGKANWTNTGEYFNGFLDNFKLYAKHPAPPLPEKPDYLLTNIKAMTKSLDMVADMEYVDTVRFREINEKTKSAKLTISRANIPGKSLENIPLTFVVPEGTVVEGQKSAYDLTEPFQVKLINELWEMEETWTVSAEMANNPVLPGRYADPDILHYNGKYYIYPTTDGYPGWSGSKFKVFSSDDLIDWEDEGVIIDMAATVPYLNDKGVEVGVHWARDSAWAPGIIEKNGKIYHYGSGHHVASNAKAIGVSVADSPTGPFVTLPAPLLTLTQARNDDRLGRVTMGQVIDPFIFTDDDGRSYMLYGNGNLAVVELGEDMMSLVPGTHRNISGASNFREAIAVHKIDGMYHFTWSVDDTGSENYHVRYGISDSIYGPIMYKGILLEKDNSQDIKGSAHHTILHHKERGEFYIIYHRFWTPLGQFTTGGAGNHREVAIDKLEYKDGLFQPAKPTHTGITAPVPAKEPATYTVMFIVDGEDYTQVGVIDGNRVREPLGPEKYGYTFDGWLLDNKEFDFNTAVTEDIILAASWKLNPITSIRIDESITKTVARGDIFKLGLILNDNAIDKNVVWTLSDPSFALVDDAGTIYILNKTGTVRLIATDPVSGLFHSITLRIVNM